MQAQEGISCLNILDKLETNSRSGSKVLVTQCCGGIRLYARLRTSGSGLYRRTVASDWRAEDDKGRNLVIRQQKRTRNNSVQGRIKERITETLVVIDSQKLCFVIEQFREVVR